jgi:hypothetical protein
MMKQGNSNSDLLDQLIKAAEGVKPREYRNDFIHQITPILESKPKSFREVLAEVLNKKAQIGAGPDSIEDPATEMDPMGDVGGDPGGDLGGDLGEEPAPGDELGAEGAEDPAALVSQALELIQKAQAALGGGAGGPEPGADELGELGGDLDVADDAGGAGPVTDAMDAGAPSPEPDAIPNGTKRAGR